MLTRARAREKRKREQGASSPVESPAFIPISDIEEVDQHSNKQARVILNFIRDRSIGKLGSLRRRQEMVRSICHERNAQILPSIERRSKSIMKLRTCLPDVEGTAAGRVVKRKIDKMLAERTCLLNQLVPLEG